VRNMSQRRLPSVSTRMATLQTGGRLVVICAYTGTCYILGLLLAHLRPGNAFLGPYATNNETGMCAKGRRHGLQYE